MGTSGSDISPGPRKESNITQGELKQPNSGADTNTGHKKSLNIQE